MGQCNIVSEWCELTIYEIVSSALLSHDIFTDTKGAGTHLHLMQIRSRCFRSAHSGLRSRTVFYLLLYLSPSLLLSFLLLLSLSYAHSCSPSLPPARTSRAGSLSEDWDVAWRHHSPPTRPNTVKVLSALPVSRKILIIIKKKINISSKIRHTSNRKIITEGLFLSEIFKNIIQLDK